MFTTLSNGRAGIRSLLQIEARSPSVAVSSDSPNSQVTGTGNVAEPSNDPILDFIVSDESLDRFGEVISASGWRLEAYRRNPVFQNAHQYGDILFTLGKALITEVRLALATPHSPPASAVLFQRIQFATGVNPMARIAYGLYRGRFLNAVSVGFIPLRWQDGAATAGGVSPSSVALSHPLIEGRGENRAARLQASRKYLEQELLEVSAVAIPANPNALALGLKSGAIDKSDLADTLDRLRSLIIDYRSSRPPAARNSSSTSYLSHSILTFARELRRILRRG
ncbi:MAG TPA: hypothetical protein VFE51_17805 [Verrucomicrobiae bacterium]|nr:hypothetical protein [Verrucomicrobiae bacterium]